MNITALIAEVHKHRFSYAEAVVTLADEVIKLRGIIGDLLMSYEPYALKEKDPEQYDPYDEMMAPIWAEARKAVDE